MTRRVGVVFVAVCAVTAWLVVEQARNSVARADGTRPNVVVILVDDAMYREIQFMPQVQSLLAQRGTTFPNYFDSTSVCCPARAGILSGQYNVNNRVKSNADAGKFNHSNQVGKWLQDAGYQTALLGKYLNGYACTKPVPPGWSHWQGVCKGWNQQYKYTLNDRGHLVYYGESDADYQVDVLRDRMVDTINEFADNPDPFFVYVAPTVPHAPPQIAKRHLKAVVPTVPISPAFDEADVSDKSPWIRAQPRLTSAQKASITRGEVGRMRMLLAADDLVKAAIDTLSQRDELDNTVVMFMNDNGYMRGEHRLRNGKGDIYFESMNAGPLIVRGPGFPEGATNSSVVGNIDLAPTIVDLAGAVSARTMDGKSVMPLVADPAAGNHRVYLHWVASEHIGAAVAPVADGLRTARYAYFRYRDAAHTEELYDYAHDPWELNNVAYNADYAAVKAELLAILTPLTTCKGTQCHVTFDDHGPTSETTSTSTSTTTTTSSTTVPEETTTTSVPEETTTTVADEPTTVSPG